VAFLVLGGGEEEARNEQILEGLRSEGLAAVGGGSRNSLHEFAALVSRCDLAITSDSLCLHVAIARRVPVVAFFAPTSAPEIELYGLGEKVVSTAPDQCSYRPDADNSTITPDRLVEAALKALREPGEQESDKQ
jgi:heptosyltransferase-2